jgi:hypothetical protein
VPYGADTLRLYEMRPLEPWNTQAGISKKWFRNYGLYYEEDTLCQYGTNQRQLKETLHKTNKSRLIDDIENSLQYSPVLTIHDLR